MKVSDVIELVSLPGGATVSRAQAVATKLREISLLPKGGRGLHAPEIDLRQGMLFALTIAAADRVEDVREAVGFLLGLEDSAGNGLLDFVVAMMSRELGDRVHHVRVMSALPSAEIVFDVGDVQTTKYFFLPTLWQNPSFKPAMQGVAYVGRMGHVGGAVLRLMVKAHAEPTNVAGELVA